jgi:hypothetical protein
MQVLRPTSPKPGTSEGDKRMAKLYLDIWQIHEIILCNEGPRSNEADMH